jgi:ferredoxin, 2Fe-2S
MTTLKIVRRDGTACMIEGTEGRSVMEVMRGNGIDDILALCGGCCSCATCHVYVDPQFGAFLPPMNDDEKALLDSLSHRNERSRLSCQLKLAAALNGMTIMIAPEE